MNKNERKCLVSKLNNINEEMDKENNLILELEKRKNRDVSLIEWCEIVLRLLNNKKIMIEQALINDFLEELV